ncbi:MAG TPA: tetratricopeptide repeat protein [Steroidobacteraceae bacterium]|nr:tetratricopeptide repeat protein [Steroidobacteraceae bacterium]
MDQTNAASQRIKFGCFEADLRSAELTKQGKRIMLQEQPFRLLAMLIERRGELVTREEVRQKLWPNTIVDFDHGLNKAISKIRDALGDSAEKPRFIETVARRGYRFLADVRDTTQQERQAAAPRLLSPVDQGFGRDAGQTVGFRVSRRRPVLSWLLSAAAVALLLLSAWMVSHRQHAVANIRSIAVLPLTNLSGDAAQEYFADGMTDELIAQLGQINALRVISRTSAMAYKNTRKSLADVARELDVQAVVEGSVLRVGDRVRITAQLIRVPADEHLWAHSYEGSFPDTLVLQGEVSQAIARQIFATVSPRDQGTLRKAKTVNAEAYEAYLKGRYFWNKRDAAGLKKAIEYFQRAIAVDPGYAQAYSGLADAYALAGGWEYGVLTPQEAAPRAREAASRAVYLDPALSEGHTSLAFALDVSSWDWNGAEREFRRALELNPGYATAHHWYGYHLMLVGRDNEGIAELKRAESLDPLSLIISAGVADVLFIAHRFDEAIRQLQKTLDMDPNFAMAHYQRGQVLVQQHKLDAAISEFERAIELAGPSPAFDANLANAYAASGRTADARRTAADLAHLPEQSGSLDANIALIYVGLGDTDQAMRWLDKAYQAQFEPIMLVRPQFDPLRTDPRFQALMSRLGLRT